MVDLVCQAKELQLDPESNWKPLKSERCECVCVSVCL